MNLLRENIDTEIRYFNILRQIKGVPFIYVIGRMS